ncbi:MAG: hypothetical protein KC431_25185, partial [Myxococcales bacterium]|nr:hypothetical protein [Myxococcales bacterium]
VGLSGSLYSNGEYPLTGPGTGPSYHVSRETLEGTPALVKAPVMINPNQAAVLLSKSIGANQMVDGRFEVTASDGAYLYAVVTNSSSANPAINATQGGPATGDILMGGPNAYGREAGVYEHSEFLADFSVELPADVGHLGFCFNTAGKFAWQGTTLQDQTAGGLAVLDDSAERTWGNYGHHLRVELEIINPGDQSRTLTVALGSLFTAAMDQPSFTWSAPMRVGPLGSEQIVDVWTTPTMPVDELGSWMIDPGSTVVTVEVFVPGLITAGQQLQLWVN